MRELEQYVRGSQLPEPKPNRPALLRPSSVPARTASGSLGRRGEAQTPFQPVALVRQELYLNGAGRVSVDLSKVSYVSYVADAGNVAVVEYSIPAAQLPQNRFFPFPFTHLARLGADATPIATLLLPDLDEELSLWEEPISPSYDARMHGIVREERDVSITFCIGTGSDQESDRFSLQFGQRLLSTNKNLTFSAPTDTSGQTYKTVTEFGQLSAVPPNIQYYRDALIGAGAIADGFGYSLSLGVAYRVRKRWLGPAGFAWDTSINTADGRNTFVAISDGQLLHESISDGVVDTPYIGSGYRGF